MFAFVIRASGADSGKLVSAFKTASAAGNASPAAVGQRHGSRQVGRDGRLVGHGAANYLYAKGDVLVWLIATSPTLAEQFIGQLP